MNPIQKIIVATVLAFTSASLQAGDGPSAPTLEQALKLRANQAILLRPFLCPSDATLNFTHIRMGDGSVKPGETRGALLVIYSSVAGEDGQHAVLYSQFHPFTKEGSPVANFPPFNPGRDAANFVVNGRCGIIAILIGLSQPRGAAEFKPVPLPGNDIISAEVTPGDSSAIGLLLPAVQKVREAAARGG